MKKAFEMPVIEVEEFRIQDVITDNETSYEDEL